MKKLNIEELAKQISKEDFWVYFRVHSFYCYLKQYGCYGKVSSNQELMRLHGFVEVVDSGQSVYVYN